MLQYAESMRLTCVSKLHDYLKGKSCKADNDGDDD